MPHIVLTISETIRNCYGYGMVMIMVIVILMFMVMVIVYWPTVESVSFMIKFSIIDVGKPDNMCDLRSLP